MIIKSGRHPILQARLRSGNAWAPSRSTESDGQGRLSARMRLCERRVSRICLLCLPQTIELDDAKYVQSSSLDWILTRAQVFIPVPLIAPLSRFQLLLPAALRISTRTEAALSWERASTIHARSIRYLIRSEYLWFDKDVSQGIIFQTEYVLIPDPCENINCGSNGVCAVYDGWQPYCECQNRYQGLKCEQPIQRSTV